MAGPPPLFETEAQAEAEAWARYFSLDYSLAGFATFWRRGGVRGGGPFLPGCFEHLAARWVAERGAAAPPPTPADFAALRGSPVLAEWGRKRIADFAGDLPRAARLGILERAAELDDSRLLTELLAGLTPPAVPAELGVLLAKAASAGNLGPLPALLDAGAELSVSDLWEIFCRLAAAPVGRAGVGHVVRPLDSLLASPRLGRGGVLAAAALELRLRGNELVALSPYGPPTGRAIVGAFRGALRRAEAWSPARAAWLGSAARAGGPRLV